MSKARWLWVVGLGCGAGQVSAGTPGPPRLRADRRRSGTGIRRSEATAGASRTSCFLMTRRAYARASPILDAMLDLSVPAARRCRRCRR